jgi:hypothetical protein
MSRNLAATGAVVNGVGDDGLALLIDRWYGHQDSSQRYKERVFMP